MAHFAKGKYAIPVSKFVPNPESFNVHNRDLQRDHRILVVMKMMRENRTTEEMGKVMGIQAASVSNWITKNGLFELPAFKAWAKRTGERMSKGHQTASKLKDLRRQANSAMNACQSTNMAIMAAIQGGNNPEVKRLQKELKEKQTAYVNILNEIRDLDK